MKSLAVIFLIAAAFGAGVYAFLEQFNWGRVVLEIIMSMLSFEAGVGSMVSSGKPFWHILAVSISADLVNISLDLFIASRLIAWKFFKSKVDWISQQLNKALFRLGNFIRSLFSWLPIFRRSRFSSPSRLSKAFKAAFNHLNGFKKNPSKVGLGGIFILGLVPRLPFLVVGGVSVAIFLIRYNRLNYKAWVALFLGIIAKTAFWFSSFYGLFSII